MSDTDALFTRAACAAAQKDLHRRAPQLLARGERGEDGAFNEDRIFVVGEDEGMPQGVTGPMTIGATWAPDPPAESN